MTGISDNTVCDANRFAEVAGSFIRFIQQHADDHDDHIDHIVMVRHNGRVFDIPFFLHQLYNNNMAEQFFIDRRFGFGLDTMRIAKKAVAADTSRGASIPPAYNLKQLYEFVTGKSLDNAHRAYDNVQATIQILRHKLFWDSRKLDVFQFTALSDQQPPPSGTDQKEEDDGNMATAGSSGGGNF